MGSKGKVIEAKNLKTGSTHTEADFQRDRQRSIKRRMVG
jgi:hypothetical protein